MQQAFGALCNLGFGALQLITGSIKSGRQVLFADPGCLLLSHRWVCVCVWGVLKSWGKCGVSHATNQLVEATSSRSQQLTPVHGNKSKGSSQAIDLSCLV